MFKSLKGTEESAPQTFKMADLEAEAEQFIGDDEDYCSKSKDKPLFNMLTRNNLAMYLQFVFFGIGSVLPIFVIFAAVDYFDNIFPHKQPLQSPVVLRLFR